MSAIGKNHANHEQDKGLGFDLQARWAVGPMTPGWAELWRRILSDVLDNPKSVVGDTREPSNDN